jgi:hypothetical protein
LRAKGYVDIEIEALFAKYDLDGDRVLNEEEQKNMMKDLAEQNEELKQAYAVIENEKGEEYLKNFILLINTINLCSNQIQNSYQSRRRRRWR